MDGNELTLAEASQKLAQGAISSEELTGHFLERIERLDPQIHAFITVDREGALRQAREADDRLRSGQATPLTGIPLAHKDLFCTKDLPTTCGSRMLANFTPPYDATVTAKLRQAGAVFLGKANMDEFAMGSSTETSYFGPTRNPWDPTRTPGGSSGGSAAAVAAGLALAATGTDTGGSIRQPAALTGIVGLKPTYGRVSRFGMIAFASSLDQAGPMTRTVEDAAMLLAAMAGHDPLDATSIPAPVPDYTLEMKQGIRGLRIGLPREYFGEGLSPTVAKTVEEAGRQLQALGAELVSISLPHTHHAIPTYYILAPAEASSNLARYDGVKFGHRCKDPVDLLDLYTRSRQEGFGSEVKRRIMLGTYVLSSGYYDAYYRKAQKVRYLIARDFRQAFSEVDLLLTPTTPETAFPLGARTEDPVAMYLADIFTINVNLAGLPGISLPCGFDEAGLPVGMQLIAPPPGGIGVVAGGIRLSAGHLLASGQAQSFLLTGNGGIMSTPYQVVIGLEVHAQMLTASKIFCGCSTRFGAPPNTQICPVCAGFPGVLPILNQQAVDMAIRAGLAIQGQVNPRSEFSRKNYFYPDLPNGYQITQFELPIVTGGFLEIPTPEGGEKRIGITRIHMEVDAGKSLHENIIGGSLVDLNRTGVPLLEIVSDPDMRSSQEAGEYLKKLRALLRHIEVCDGNMEQGSLRCDANVSIRPMGSPVFGTRCELKNMNSIRNVMIAIDYEVGRQIDLVESGGRVVQETRLWDPGKGVTRPMRGKEEAHDYRYFPEPDLPPLTLQPERIAEVLRRLPELPDRKKARFQEEYALSPYDATVLTASRELSDYFERVAATTTKPDPKAAANWVTGELLAILNREGREIEQAPVSAEHLGKLIGLIQKETISGKIAKQVFALMWEGGGDPETIVREKGLVQVTDSSAIEAIVDQVLAAHPDDVAQYKAGKGKVMGFLVGEVMKASRGKANPQLVNRLLAEKLSS